METIGLQLRAAYSQPALLNIKVLKFDSIAFSLKDCPRSARNTRFVSFEYLYIARPDSQTGGR